MHTRIYIYPHIHSNLLTSTKALIRRRATFPTHPIHSLTHTHKHTHMHSLARTHSTHVHSLPDAQSKHTYTAVTHEYALTRGRAQLFARARIQSHPYNPHRSSYGCHPAGTTCSTAFQTFESDPRDATSTYTPAPSCNHSSTKPASTPQPARNTALYCTWHVAISSASHVTPCFSQTSCM